MCLRDQIFRVLLEPFMSEVVHKWQRDQMFYVLLVHFVINFVRKWLREQMFEDFYCIISLILCKSCCGSNRYISFSVFYHRFCAKMTARAVMILRVTASESEMCGGLDFLLFFH